MELEVLFGFISSSNYMEVDINYAGIEIDHEYIEKVLFSEPNVSQI